MRMLTVRSSCRRWLATVAFTGMLSWGLGGCSQGNTPSAPSTPETRATGMRVPALSEGQRYVVEPFTQQLVAYDMNMRAPAQASDEVNFFYYKFGTLSNLYTSGNSATGGFSLVEVSSSEVRTVATTKDNEALFPIAQDGEVTIFVLYTFDDERHETARRLVRMTSPGVFEPFVHATGLIASGAVVGETLYYTTVDADEGTYDLWSVSKTDLDAEPEHERSGMDGGELYEYRGQLLTSDGTTIHGGPRDYECSDNCWFLDDFGVLVRDTADGSGGLRLDVIDMDSGETVHEVPGALGFDLSDGTLTTFCDGSIDEYRL